jgi:hypothetical protein
MDLNALHSIMSRKKYHYFEGKTNDSENNLYLSFSTLHNGRGNIINIRIGDINNDINCLVNNNRIENKQITDNDIFLILEELN